MMTVFEPLFLLLALVTVLTLVTVLGLALFGRVARAWRILRRLLVGAAVYMSVVVAVSVFTPRNVRSIGEMKCFDDWCFTVQRAVRDTPASYEVTLTLSSRARRVPQGERGTHLYILDSTGRRYEPVAETVPFEYPLQPGESIQATRRYVVSPDATGLSLVYLHDRGFPIGWFIIGENNWIHGAGVFVPIS